LGVVNLDSHLDFAYNKSKEEASKTATKYAQEVMNRALSRVIEKKRTQRTVTTIIQTEDKNSHTLDNTSVTGGTPTDNIAGTYRWVDKLYLAKVVNYGKRLMFEFVVPEPAAFYLYSKANKPQDGNAILKPLYPSKFSAVKYVSTGGKESTEPLASFKDITVSNYAALAAKYNAQDVVPPPPSLKIVTTEVKYDRPAETKTDKDDESYKGDKYFTITSKELKIPPGYKAKHADVSFKRPPGFIMGPLGTGGVFTERLSILIGNKQLTNYDDQNNFTEFSSPQWMIPLNIEDDTVPLSIIGSANHFIANVEVICDVTQEKLDEWRKDTFNSIIAAYYARLEEYKNWLRQQNTAAGIVISGNNPLANRETEREELKKHCIEIISGQRFETFDAMRSNVERGYPEFSFNEATAEGSYVQFFEQAFEWEQITYVFYPYFWGRKPNWIMVKNIEDTDPLFTNFLQAGAARVLVPTRLGFETDVIHYFASNGEIWHGKDAPIPSDERWISIVDEIKEQQGQFEGGVQHGDPWVIKMPTSLVYLEKVNSPLPDLSATFKDDLAKIKPAW
jgi:hypothetical protein